MNPSSESVTRIIDEPSEAVDFIRDRLVFAGEVGYSGKHLER